VDLFRGFWRGIESDRWAVGGGNYLKITWFNNLYNIGIDLFE